MLAFMMFHEHVPCFYTSAIPTFRVPMIIQCPACATKYSVSDASLGKHGRTVRCKNCGNSWFYSGQETSEAGSSEDIDENIVSKNPSDQPAYSDSSDASFSVEATSADTSLVAERDEAVAVVSVAKKHNEKLLPTMAVLIFSLAIVLTPVALLAQRIQSAWPPAGRIYDLVGMATVLPGQSLKLDDVHAVLRTENGSKILTLDGLIRNAYERKTQVPMLNATLIHGGNAIKTWDFSSNISEVSKKDPARFSATLDGGDATDGNVVLTFVPQSSPVQTP